jgi:cell division protein FtsB
MVSEVHIHFRFLIVHGGNMTNNNEALEKENASLKREIEKLKETILNLEIQIFDSENNREYYENAWRYGIVDDC